MVYTTKWFSELPLKMPLEVLDGFVTQDPKNIEWCYPDGPVSPSLDGLLTLSPANTLNDSITCSAVSLSVVSLVMNSINDLNVTCPVPVGSTIAKIRWNSASPLNKTRLTLVGIISRKRGRKKWRKIICSLEKTLKKRFLILEFLYSRSE